MDETRGAGPALQRRHETSDANPRSLITFVAGLIAFIIIVIVISEGVFRYFVRRQPLGPPASPFEDLRTLPPEPRLQVTAPQELQHYKAAQEELLNSYGWVDPGAGVVRIPIGRAMDILIEKGLPVRNRGDAKSAGTSSRAGKFRAGLTKGQHESEAFRTSLVVPGR